jgi:hypothetical protein
LNKSNLPYKLDPVCNRDLTWRKKWKVEWDNVVYCSERCSENKNEEIENERIK